MRFGDSSSGGGGIRSGQRELTRTPGNRINQWIIIIYSPDKKGFSHRFANRCSKLGQHSDQSRRHLGCCRRFPGHVSSAVVDSRVLSSAIVDSRVLSFLAGRDMAVSASATSSTIRLLAGRDSPCSPSSRFSTVPDGGACGTRHSTNPLTTWPIHSTPSSGRSTATSAFFVAMENFMSSLETCESCVRERCNIASIFFISRFLSEIN